MPITTLNNMGTAGTVIDATNTGLVDVEGGAVWFPPGGQVTGNYLSVAGFADIYADGVLPLPYIDGTLQIREQDIIDPAATEFLSWSNHLVVVNRATTGPTTTLVPAGVRTLINPDGAGNNLLTPADPVLDIEAGDDAVIVWCGQPGNLAGGTFPFITNNAGAASPAFALLADAGGAIITDGVWTVTADPVPFTPLAPTVLIGRYNAATDVLDLSAYTTEGLTGRTTSSGEMGPVAGANGLRSMFDIPGAVTGMAWNTGFGIAPTDEELDDIADWFLESQWPPVPPQPTYLTTDGFVILSDRLGRFLTTGE